MFNPDLKDTFVTFSRSHLIATGFIFLLIALVIINKEKLKNPKILKPLSITLGVMTLTQELLLNVYRIAFGEWELSTSLPLQLCGLGVITTSIILLTKSKKLFVNTFFIMMIGATMALLTPSINQNLGFPHFRFFQFFTSHGLIVINFTVILFVYDYQKEIEYRHLLNNFVTLCAIAVVLLGVNLLVDGNYMYLLAKPGPNTAFDLFGEHPWYLLNILIFGIPVLFHIFYFPFFIRNYRSKRKEVTA